MDLSFIIPIYNEINFLPKTLKAINNQILGEYKIEVLLIDGHSDDGSREYIEKFINNNNNNNNINYILLNNKNKKTPYAFNIGIKYSKSQIVGFGGAHTYYPNHFLYNAIELHKKNNAQVIGGGHSNYIPDKNTNFGKALACLYLSPFGSGVAQYHRLNKPSFVDTVYGGFYKKKIFQEIGLFNTKLIKNQDNELNSRVINNGYKILFHPILSTDYIHKTDLKTFFYRPFLFGLFHFNTWKINPSSIKIRHIIPFLFFVYLNLILILISMNFLHWIFLFPLILYFICLFINSIYFILNKGIIIGLMTFPVFFTHHLSYGFGTFYGFFITKKN